MEERYLINRSGIYRGLRNYKLKSRERQQTLFLKIKTQVDNIYFFILSSNTFLSYMYNTGV